MAFNVAYMIPTTKVSSQRKACIEYEEKDYF